MLSSRPGLCLNSRSLRRFSLSHLALGCLRSQTITVILSPHRVGQGA